MIAHEVGHHVQKLLGIADKVQSIQAAGRRARGQCRSSPHGAAGRLLCRRLGGAGGPRQGHPGAGRHRGGPQRRERHRRRQHPEADARAASSRMPSRTAHPSSACAGSSGASRRATRAIAIRSAPRSFRAKHVPPARRGTECRLRRAHRATKNIRAGRSARPFLFQLVAVAPLRDCRRRSPSPGRRHSASSAWRTRSAPAARWRTAPPAVDSSTDRSGWPACAPSSP